MLYIYIYSIHHLSLLLSSKNTKLYGITGLRTEERRLAGHRSAHQLVWLSVERQKTKLGRTQPRQYYRGVPRHAIE